MAAGRDAGVPNEVVVSTYDRFATAYDWATGPLEAGTRRLALDDLDVAAGDTALEVGCGPGHALSELAARVGATGRVLGLDAAPGMVTRARRHVERADAADRVDLLCGDARALPLGDGVVDVAFVEDTLELFSPTDTAAVLAELARVLTADGRLGVVTMERAGAERAVFTRAYEWAFDTLPGYDRVGCRPVYARRSLEDAGFEVLHQARRRRWGVWPVEILIARPPETSARTQTAKSGA